MVDVDGSDVAAARSGGGWAQHVESATSLPELFFARVRSTPRNLAYKYHAGGGWHDVTWVEFEKRVREVAAGLLTLGLEVGERVAVLGDTRAEWGTCDLGALVVGGVTVGLYQTNTAEQCHYILDHSQARVLFVDGAAQLEKIRLVRGRLGNLSHVVVWDAPADLRAEAGELSLYALLKQGRGASAEVQGTIDARARVVDVDAAANLIYTSGTTGPPKGAMLSHRNITALLQTQDDFEFFDDDITLSFLPMCHVAEKVISFYGRLRHGMATAYARSLEFEVLLDDIKTVRPTVFGAVPRIFEKVYAKATLKAEASPAKRWVFKWALEVGRRYSRAQRGQGRMGRRLRAQYALADRMVFSKVRELFGGRVRVFITGAAPINVEILEFFHASGMLVLELYGMTETTGVSTANRPDDFRFGTVGKPLAGVEVKLSQEGEILVRGATVFKGYFRDEAATQEAIEDGWMHTGDVGVFDAEGYLTITDRIKNLIITSGGKNIAPQNIENLVKDDPFISTCVLIGDRRNYLTALVTLDEDEAPGLAERLGVSFRAPEAMTMDPKVVAHVKAAIDRVNTQVSRVEQIRDFRILPRDLTIEDGEITPTLKVRRQVVEAKYKDLVESMYPT